MRKIFLLMFVVLATTGTIFTSCASDKEITLANIAGATFEGKDSAESTYVIKFENSSNATFEFSITDKGKKTPNNTYTGKYSVSSNVVTLTYSSGKTVETMTGDGTNKLLYNTVTVNGDKEQMTLKKK